MDVKYLDEEEWAAFLAERREQERILDEKIQRGEVSPESVSFGYQLAKRVKKINWDPQALKRFKL